MRAAVCLIIIASVISGCRRELSYNYIDYAQIAISFDWAGSGVYPDDATVIFYPKNATGYFSYAVNRDRDVVKLRAGVYSVIAFNQKFDDFDGIVFRDVDRYETIRAELKTQTTDNPTSIHTMPDGLAIASIDRFEVTPDMVEQMRLQAKSGKSNNQIAMATIALNPKSMVHKFKTAVRIGKINSVRSVRAQVEGLPRSLFLRDGAINADQAVNMFDMNDIQYLPTSSLDGMAVGSITCFNLDKNHDEQTYTYSEEERNSEHIILTIDVVLRDKAQTSIRLVRDITNKIDEYMQGEVPNDMVVIGDGSDPGDNPIVPPDIEIDDPPSGGFDPGVDGWGDEDDVEVEL